MWEKSKKEKWIFLFTHRFCLFFVIQITFQPALNYLVISSFG